MQFLQMSWMDVINGKKDDDKLTCASAHVGAASHKAEQLISETVLLNLIYQYLLNISAYDALYGLKKKKCRLPYFVVLYIKLRADSCVPCKFSITSSE